MSPGEAAITVRGLGRRFKGTWALRGISLEVERGELFGVVGPDGSGKTSLMQSICAILDPTEGEVTVAGLDTVRDAPVITSRLGYMSQAWSLYGDLTVEENLEFFSSIRGVPEKDYMERKGRLLEFSGLAPFLARRAGALSGGMQKKLALCCNLVHEPDILVLDEPTLGVDPVSRRHLWEMLADYHGRGKTIVVATSYMDEAERCSRVAFLHGGGLIGIGPPSSFGADLEEAFVSRIPRPRAGKGTLPFPARAFAGDAISVKDLTRRFGDFTAVDGLTFDVARGEVFGFLGPNGSGKSTTIRMLCGIIPPTEGSIEVSGVDVAERPGEARGRIGYMSQRFSLYLDLTVGENIEFFGRVYGLDRHTLGERTEWVIEMAGLAGEERSLAGRISGAMRQRLSLGCSLLHHPEVLFLDEPTSGVDPVSRRAFWEMIRSVAGSGTTVFVTTHYIKEAENCGRVAFINRGRILAFDAPGALRESYGAATLDDAFIKAIEETGGGR